MTRVQNLPIVLLYCIIVSQKHRTDGSKGYTFYPLVIIVKHHIRMILRVNIILLAIKTLPLNRQSEEVPEQIR